MSQKLTLHNLQEFMGSGAEPGGIARPLSGNMQWEQAAAREEIPGHAY